MRVAVLQIVLDPTSRAENVQRISASIDAAAGVVPPPDLIALPGACDTGGKVGASGRIDASLTAVRERIAWKAKEWGVYIAAGLHRRRGDSFEPWSVLIDPDGDVAADTWQDETRAEDSRLQSCATPLGRVGVADLFDGRNPSTVDIEVLGDDIVIVVVPMVRPNTAKVRRSLEAIVADLRNGGKAGAGSCWVVVGSSRADAADGVAMRSFIRGADGVIVAEADAMGEQVFHAEVAPAET